ncbi:hypothetical protein BDA99DRAFT_566362 [Phascolomyces articulosus]|uniref:PH domain-containing protein n=1 Tax=Phascolomyces articulosus TaxID=60185 RepID=A0AAD5JZD1_9FUNG|nr:hypothetical protein BDA99DRAFT_566362 [Phascolomyces articulosus]
MTVTNAPLAGWLAKLISLPLGRTRWQYRYFVLLDSELRFYKDEHSDSASHVLNLSSVSDIIQLALPNHSFCIRLEPRLTARSKPWTLACSSQVDLEMWTHALQKRLARSTTFIPCLHEPLSMDRRKRPTNSWFSQPPSSFIHLDDDDNTTLFDDDNNNNMKASIIDEDYYHAITPETVVRPRIQKNINKRQPPRSLSRRRGIYLDPLMIASSPFDYVSTSKDDTDYYVNALSSFSTSPTTSSSGISLSSSSSSITAAVDTYQEDDENKIFIPRSSFSSVSLYEDEEELLDRERSMSAPDILQTTKNKHALVDGETSPTFLLYKKQFHLC